MPVDDVAMLRAIAITLRTTGDKAGAAAMILQKGALMDVSGLEEEYRIVLRELPIEAKRWIVGLEDERGGH